MKKLVLVLFAAFLSLAAFGQVTTSSIRGKVVDSNGEPLAGATIKAVHQPTGTIYATSSLANGDYYVGSMRIGGPYLIEVSYIGYRGEAVSEVSLVLGQEGTFNFSLREDTQAIGEVVVVGRANPVMSSNRTGAQEVITRAKMEQLPAFSRSLDNFTKLTPMSSGGNFGGTSYRFNNITVDGASFNNSFGLSSSLGASGIEPISLEAIEQVQVMIAPYDVRNGAFTGAGINSVTKSGTNDFEAAAYMYTKSPDLSGWRIKNEIIPQTEFKTRQYGFSFGGPIIKNKLFYFVNAEFDRLENAVTYRPRPNTNTPATGAYSIADLETLNELSAFLGDKFGYNPGSPGVSKVPTEADRLTLRLDWNINKNNTLSFKYYYLESFSTSSPSSSGAPSNGRGPNAYAIPFSSSYYRLNNDFNIFMVDLESKINEKLSNSLKIGYSRLRDRRSMDGGFFPQVDIMKDGNAFTTFGTEVNSYGNMLNSDIIQLQDNLNLQAGKHQLTFGTQSDYRKFKNGYGYAFAGTWRYADIQDFYNDVNNYFNWVNNGGTRPTSTAIPGNFTQSYSKKGAFPYAEVEVLTLGFYVQDKWTPRPNLNFTLGLRVDTPIFLNDLERNPEVEELVFQGGEKIDVSKYPDTKPLLSPRFGFNWDVLGDRRLQVRGGTGLFTGTPPYVWLSNQAGNNGLLFGRLAFGRPFDGVALYQPSEDEIQNSKMDLAVTAKNFKYPQLWKTNIAVDFNIWDGWILTGELLYNKDVNAIYHRNIGLNEVQGYVIEGGEQGRPFFAKGVNSSQRPTDYYITDKTENVIQMRNTSKGYSIYTTFQLQKDYVTGPMKGFYFNGSFTFGRSKSVTDGSSSVASSAWKYRPAVDPNAQELAYSAASFDHRLLLSVSYTAEWSEKAATRFGLIYQRYRPYRYSYTYDGDVNGDGQNMNDLMYIPRDMSDIRIVPGRGDTSSPQEIWNEINSFIEQDSYLRKHRGSYAERNGGKVRFAHQLDFHVSHDIRIPLANGKVNTLRFSFDVENFLNLINKDWGVQWQTVYGYSGSPQFQFLQMTEAPSEANNYTPGFTIKRDRNYPGKTFKRNIGSVSRWQAQFGIKYMFN